jgi:hypothetical protein
MAKRSQRLWGTWKWKYSYQVIAVNANGTSEPSDPFVIYYDTQIPTATLTSAPDNNSYINGNFDVKVCT